jgi:hypothetical protein
MSAGGSPTHLLGISAQTPEVTQQAYIQGTWQGENSAGGGPPKPISGPITVDGAGIKCSWITPDGINVLTGTLTYTPGRFDDGSSTFWVCSAYGISRRCCDRLRFSRERCHGKGSGQRFRVRVVRAAYCARVICSSRRSQEVPAAVADGSFWPTREDSYPEVCGSAVWRPPAVVETIGGVIHASARDPTPTCGQKDGAAQRLVERDLVAYRSATVR